jgi:RsiW-degrading membrane proteinase PrsW (M82 family)
MVDYTMASIVVGAAFIPPIIYMIYIRNQERRHREPWGRVFSVFFYGAIISVLFALILELVFDTQFHRVYDVSELQQYGLSQALLLAVVGAPIIEELTKAFGVRGARRDIREPEDGIVYGVAAGLGFSATENLLYEVAALLEGGTYAFVATAVIRSITGSFLHATATGIVGYGMAKKYLKGGTLIEVVPYYAIAVLLHAAFNLLASLQLAFGVAFLILMSFIAIKWTVNRIRELDKTSRPISVR